MYEENKRNIFLSFFFLFIFHILYAVYILHILYFYIFLHISDTLYVFYIFHMLKIKYSLYELNHIVLVYPRVVRSIESQPFHVNLVTLSAQNFLHEIHVRVSRATQLVLVERPSDRFFAIVLE